MTPRDIFGLILRTSGLLILFYWATSLFMAILIGNWGMVVVSLVVFLIGRYLLKGAPLILDFAYPQQRAGLVGAVEDRSPSVA